MGSTRDLHMGGGARAKPSSSTTSWSSSRKIQRGPRSRGWGWGWVRGPSPTEIEGSLEIVAETVDLFDEEVDVVLAHGLIGDDGAEKVGQFALRLVADHQRSSRHHATLEDRRDLTEQPLAFQTRRHRPEPRRNVPGTRTHPITISFSIASTPRPTNRWQSHLEHRNDKTRIKLVRLAWLRLGCISLGYVRLDQVGLGYIRLGFARLS